MIFVVVNQQCRQFGEGIAILAGDGLLTMAFEILSRCGQEQIAEKGFGSQQYLQAIHEISGSRCCRND